MLRAIATFLIGAGVMLGAFLTGLAQRVPDFFSHYGNAGFSRHDESGLSRYDEPRFSRYADGDARALGGPRISPAVLTPDGRSFGDLDAPSEGRYGPPFSVRVETLGGNLGTSDCGPTYRFYNDTGLPIAFTSDDGGRGVEVPPGGDAEPDLIDGPQNGCGPIVRIKLER